LIQCAIDSIQFERHLAEPADVRANPTAAFAPRNLRWRLAEVRVVKGRAAATVAAAFEEFSVHVDNSPRTRLLVKGVYVLSTNEKPILQQVFKLGEGEVRTVRFGRRSHTPPHRVELPHQPGIAMPSLGRGDLLDPMATPEALHTPESWDAAFRAYPRPGQNEDVVSGSYGEH
jgi:hypothetical protein